MLQIKFFIGIRLTPELKHRLLPHPSLQQVPHEGKEYFGHYLNSTHPTLIEIRSASRDLSNILQHCFPDQRCDALPILLFPQVFLG
jgi:hypothetical protein